jgi:hypothetical protein
MKKFLPRKKINENVLAPLLEHAAKTKAGCFRIAKAMSKTANPNLPTGGKLKAALNEAKKTADHLMVGLATVLDPPDNPDRLKSFMTMKKLAAAALSPAAAPMNPRNPKLSNSLAVLPERRVDPKEEAAPTANPSTIESIAAPTNPCNPQLSN